MQAGKRFISLLLAALMVLSLSGITGIIAFADDEEIVNNIPLRDYFPNINDPDFFDKMPAEMGLQDPFTFFTYEGDTRTPEEMPGTNGKVVTDADWLERREEIKDLMQYYWYGYKWVTPKEAYTSVSFNPSNGQITATIDNSKDPMAVALGLGDRTWTGTVGTITMPTDAQIDASPFNKVDGIPWASGLSQAQVRAAGIATVSTSNTGYTNLYPYLATETYRTASAKARDSWGTTRFINALEILAEQGTWTGIDPLKGAVVGVSTGGKTALMQGILEDRIALCVPVESGGTGMGVMQRGGTEGRLNYHRGDALTGTGSAFNKDIHRVGSFHETYTLSGADYSAPVMKAFFSGINEDGSARADYIPFDAHLNAALMAPVKGGYGNDSNANIGKNRAIIAFVNNNQGTWTAPIQQTLNMAAAKEVYDFLGSDNIVNKVRNENHATQSRDVADIIALLKSMFGRTDGKVDVEYISGLNHVNAANVYDKMSDMSAAPYEIDSSYIQWANPKAHTIWTESEVIGADIANTIVAHSDAEQVKLTALAPYPVADASFTPVVRDVMWEMTADVVDGEAIFDLSADEVKVGRYELTAIGDKESRSAYFQAIDAATALRSGMTRDNLQGGLNGGLYGFSSKITNRSEVELYAKNRTSGALTAIELGDNYSNVVSEQKPGWIAPYGVAVSNAYNSDALVVKNLKMEAMAGYTFEFSFPTYDTTYFLHAATGGNWGQVICTWATSLESQNLGPWPNWPGPGGNGGNAGQTADNGARPALANRTTNVLTAEAAGAQFSYDIGVKAMVPGSKLTVSFALAMNPDDFAIGFDFSEDFSIEWAEGNTAVIITFNSFKADADGFNTYIARLRSGANFITAPIASSLDGLPKYALNVSSDKKRLVNNDEYFDVAAKFSDIASTNALTLTYTYDASKVKYRGFEAASGLNVLSTTADPENGTITFVIANTNGYEIEDIGFARFSVLEDANLAVGTTSVNVAASFVFKDEDGQKTIMSRTNIITFKTGNPLPDILTLIDLSNAIDFFGAEIGDDNWNEASLYDINDDNKVDILDITNIASRI